MQLVQLAELLPRRLVMIVFVAFSFLDHLLKFSSDCIASSLSEEHNLETFEVGQVAPGLLSLEFLSIG